MAKKTRPKKRKRQPAKPPALDTLKRLYAAPQLLPLTFQICDELVFAFAQRNTADASMCLAALRFTLDALAAATIAKTRKGPRS